MTKNLQSHWRRKLMKFWITHLRSRFAPVRYDPLSSYVYHMYIALCLPPTPPPKFCIDYCFQILLGGLYIPKRIWTQYLMQNLLGKQSALWGIRKSSVGKRCVRTRRTSSSLFSSTEQWNFFGLAQTRVLESKIPPTYVLASERPHSD